MEKYLPLKPANVSVFSRTYVKMEGLTNLKMLFSDLSMCTMACTNNPYKLKRAKSRHAKLSQEEVGGNKPIHSTVPFHLILYYMFICEIITRKIKFTY